jgi:hypothetical protein
VSSAPNKEESGWMSVHEVARALGLHNNTVKRIPPCHLPYMRVTSRGDRKYWYADVNTYIERRMVRG